MDKKFTLSPALRRSMERRQVSEKIQKGFGVISAEEERFRDIGKRTFDFIFDVSKCNDLEALRKIANDYADEMLHQAIKHRPKNGD